MILEPLKETYFNEDELKEMKKTKQNKTKKKNTLIKIKNVLDEIQYGQDIAFDTFLKKN